MFSGETVSAEEGVWPVETSSIEQRTIRYHLLCGHSYPVPAEVEKLDDGPESPYGWCEACRSWKRVTGTVLDEPSSDPATEGD